MIKYPTGESIYPAITVGVCIGNTMYITKTIKSNNSNGVTDLRGIGNLVNTIYNIEYYYILTII
jgi:hypothetical protein